MMTNTPCKQLNFLFLGASKRVSLLERFISSAQLLKVPLKLFSCERDNAFYPISKYAEILPGPAFASEDFQAWLHMVVDNYGINIIIPNMDSATVALSKFRQHNQALSAVSSYDLCFACENKILSQQLFEQYKLPYIPNTKGYFPKIAKHKNGFGAKGIYKLEDRDRLAHFASENDISDFIIEDFIVGQETTTDLYIDPQGRLIGYVLRDRIEVSDGEVMVCETRDPVEDEVELFNKISLIPGWYGCITVQTLRDSRSKKLYLMEINPRFGGGCTAAIEAGLDMPSYILYDYLQLPYKKPKLIKRLRMVRARQDFFCEIKNDA